MRGGGTCPVPTTELALSQSPERGGSSLGSRHLRRRRGGLSDLPETRSRPLLRAHVAPRASFSLTSASQPDRSAEPARPLGSVRGARKGPVFAGRRNVTEGLNT